MTKTVSDALTVTETAPLNSVKCECHSYFNFYRLVVDCSVKPDQ